MKFNTRHAVLAAALATIGLGTVAVAQDTSSTSAGNPPAVTGRMHWHHMRGAGPVAALLRATHQLNLSADQRQSIETLLHQARSQQRDVGTGPDVTVLGNPGDPNFSNAMQSLQNRSSSRIRAESELASSIYNVLTPQQRQQLPSVLASIKAKSQARRAAWRAQHSGAASNTAH